MKGSLPISQELVTRGGGGRFLFPGTCHKVGSSTHKAVLLKHSGSLQGPIEIPSLSPALLVVLQDYCSSYSSVSKRLNRPLEKATVSQRTRAYLYSFLQETDFSEKQAYTQVGFLPGLEGSYCFFTELVGGHKTLCI